MAEFIEKLDCGIMVGVGAAFDIHAGFQKDAPKWVKEIGILSAKWVFCVVF